MKRVLLAPLVLGLLVPGAAGEQAAPATSIPDLVLRLEQLQDAAAGGSAGASAKQRDVLALVSALLRRQDARTLPDPRMLRAAIAYVLSGGRPADVEVLLAATPPSDPLRWLLQGAVHYARGEREEALHAFQPFSPERLPLSIGGRVALAEAMLLPEAEVAEKIRLLNIAARLMPGTLVEEAALRRINAIAATQQDPAQFQIAAERYVVRFPASLYAPEFLAKYIADVVAFEARQKPVARSALELLLNKFPAAPRRKAYLQAARLATVRGLADFALFTASRARRLSPEGSDDWHSATLYDAAVLITGKDYDMGFDMLKAVDPARLDAGGKDLLAASLRFAAGIRSVSSPAPDQTVRTDGETTTLPPEQSAIAAKASKALQSADALLQGIAP